MLKMFLFGSLQGCYFQDLKNVISYLDGKFLRSSHEDFPKGKKKKKKQPETDKHYFLTFLLLNDMKRLSQVKLSNSNCI